MTADTIILLMLIAGAYLHLLSLHKRTYRKIQTMAANLTLQDISDAITNAQTEETAEIARFAADLAKAIEAAKLPDGSIVLSQAEAQALIDGANGIAAAAKAADATTN